MRDTQETLTLVVDDASMMFGAINSTFLKNGPKKVTYRSNTVSIILFPFLLNSFGHSDFL
jgi:hypothetical protein